MNFNFSPPLKVALTCLLICFLPLVAVAQQTGGKQQSELEALQNQIDALKEKVDQIDSDEETVLINEQSNLSNSDFNLTWHPGPVLGSTDGRFSFEVNGRLTYDYSIVNFKDGNSVERPDDKINGTDLRHLELGIRGKAFGDFNYRIVTTFVNNEVDVKMAYIDYSIGNTTIIVGKTRPFNSLDKMTSPPNAAFAERAAFTNAFGFDRRVGIGVSHHGDTWTLSGGYFFEDDLSVNGTGDDFNMVSTRLTFSPRFKNGLGLHFGGSSFYRNRNGNDFNNNYNARPFLKQGILKPLASETFNISSETFYGAEFVATYKSFALQSEIGIIKNKLGVNDILTTVNPVYQGGYVELSFFPTGGERIINGRDGRFNSVKIKSPVGAGGMGEVRLAARYDMADLTHDIFGRKQKSYILAADWYLNDLMKIQGNYARSTIKDAFDVKSDNVNTFNMRFLIHF